MMKMDKENIARLYQNNMITETGVLNAIAKGWITTDEAIDIVGEDNAINIIKNAKIAEISSSCRSSIIAGVDVGTSKGKEHFSLQETDQINLTNAAAAIQEGATSFPYHSDGNVCRLYSAREISLVSNAATQHKLYHTTLCNHLLQCIKRATTKEELDNITYSEDSLPEDLHESFNAIIQASRDM